MTKRLTGTPTPLWEMSSGGILVPAGSRTELFARSRSSYLRVKEKALDLRALLNAAGIRIGPTSGLEAIIRSAVALSDAWLRGETPAEMDLARACYLQHIADIVRATSQVPNVGRLLKRLTSGPLDSLDREPSTAKDALWELEVLAHLLGCGAHVDVDEPDLRVELPYSRVGVACKRRYSDKNFPKALSIAVSQIEESGIPGIVAVNVEELLPASMYLSLPTGEELAQRLIEFNDAFLRDHEARLKSYMDNERLVCVLVSSVSLANLMREKVFAFGRQMTLWIPPDLSSRTRSLHADLKRVLERAQIPL